MTDDILTRFSPATADWFRGAFATPTAAQQGAWEAISSGRHALVVAPTGSGKTLSAFLWALDRLATTAPPAEARRRCRVVYVSPLKALAVDVERNLRSPLVGIGHASQRLGLPVPEVTVAVRSGDTPAAERRVFAKTPADILITTPESLFLLLTSAARESLAGVETVILDEVHAVAGTKRGAHLALSLERLDALLPAPAQRIGLSATVRPIEEVSRFLAGGRPVEIVAPPSTKEWDLRVVVPVPDLGSLGEPTGDLSGPAAGDPRRTSIWPHVEERIVDLVADHRSTLVFANSRRLAERLTTRLNEIWEDRADAEAEAAAAGTATTGAVVPGGARTPATTPAKAPAKTPATTLPATGIPAQVMAQAGASRGAPALLARAHHGSVSREQRTIIEEDLKAGRLPAVVATSSLELGIDMGAVDLVVQVESPPSVASGLQRVGRAGHQVGAVSRGVLFPKFRGDLVQTAVVVERMRAGAIEALRVPANPLDVLAQQIVAMCALQDWDIEALHALVRRAAPFAGLSRLVLDSVLDMLSGRYPSDEFAELRPRIVWDRVTGTLSGRRGAQRLAVTSGGTIPDRGLYAVFLASGDGPGRRVGELDEEMVYESRVGDTFTLGTSTWRIEDITHDRVLVTPAPGQPGKLPFWKGDTIGRPPELGAAVGAFVREVGSLGQSAARERVAAAGLDDWATDNLLSYLTEQREAVGQLPSDRTIIVERFRDELGDWRIVIHSPYGGQVHAPWALAIAARMRERYGLDVQAMHGDDGIVLRLPDMDLLGADGWGDEASPPRPVGPDLSAELVELVFLDPDEVAALVTAQVGGSALFAARFRECAARALLLPRRRPDRRQALWQQRQRAAALLEVAAQYPSFPIVLEAVRECVQDVFDVPGLVDVLRRVRSREITTVSVESATPSPFARSLMFGYVAQFLYEGDSPLAEKRAAALALDPTLLAELLGQGETLALRDLLDPTAVATTEAELAHLTPERAARDAEDLADLIRALGPLDLGQLEQRVRPDVLPELPTWLAGLVRARRVIQVRIAGRDQWAAIEDAGRLRDALGASLPVGIPQDFLAPLPDPLADLVARHARTHGPFGASDIAARFGLGVAVVRDALARLVSAGRLVEGELRPLREGETGNVLDYCDARVLRLLRRRSLAALRAEVEPSGPRDLARFLLGWQHVGGGLRGVDGVLRVVEQLAGAILPASAVESLILPARITGYHPGLLDEAMAAGEVVWQGHGSLPGDDGWVSLHPADLAPLTMHHPLPLDLTPTHTALLAALDGGGAYFFAPLLERSGLTDGAAGQAALWDLVWAGLLSGDTLAPLRAHLGGGRTAHRPRAVAPRRSRYAGRAALLRSAATTATSAGGSAGASGLAARSTNPRTAGRWSLLPDIETDPTVTAYARAEVLLDRYGVLTRGAVAAEDVPGGFAGVYRLLSAAEEAGRVRRGYFVEGLGASQFGSTGAVDRLRAGARPLEDTREPTPGIILAACDPANPYGAALPWPERPTTDAGGKGHQPSRKAGALVAIVDGDLVLYVERGGRTLLTWSEDPTTLQAAADALALAVREGALGRLTVERTDGESVLRSDHPLATALAAAGFHATSRGLRIRR